MRAFALQLLMCVVAHSLVQRQHLHAEAQVGLARSAMRHTARRASRAAPHSNFGRMLQGLPHAAGNCVGNDGGNSSSGASPVIAVAAFGADPTGVADSSDAFDAALAAAIAQTAPRLMASRIRDLGGVRIDLQGGDYALSRPFRVPQWLGNFKIGGGSVRALPSFPRDRYLIEVGGNATACALADHGQKSCNANVGIEDLLVDGGNGTALGGILLNQTMGGNVGPDLYVVGFNRSGITVHGGHEVMLHEAWFGTTYYDHKDKVALGCGATAVELFGNDHVVSDVVVFAGQTGVRTTGGANLIEGVHTWNSGTTAPPCTGHGILVQAPSTRVLNVYLDYTALVIESGAKPRNAHVSVADSFFLGMGTIVLCATAPQSKIEGLVLTDNTWNSVNMPHNATVVLDERHGNAFTSVLDFVMLANIAPKALFDPRATTVTKELSLANATRWDFDFSDVLVFPGVDIVSARYSIEIDGSAFARHAARKPVGQTVAVETDVPVDAKVTITVTQSRFTAGNGPF